MRGSDGREWWCGGPSDLDTTCTETVGHLSQSEQKCLVKEPLSGQMCVAVLFLAQPDPRKKHYLSPSLLSEARHKLATLL